MNLVKVIIIRIQGKNQKIIKKLNLNEKVIKIKIKY